MWYPRVARMPNLSSSIQKLAIRLIALVAVAIGVLVAASSLDGLSTNPLQAQVQLRAVSLSSESTLLPSKDEDLVAEDYVEEVTVSPDTVAADRRPKRFYVVTITAQDNPG